mmetsp:Transcript_21459/g.55980  ORF Transcript_21459/g.55980 Transcript_21459/m.55980 type:complete len:222 (-) Transcript_21459:794-1459(-)
MGLRQGGPPRRRPLCRARRRGEWPRGRAQRAGPGQHRLGVCQELPRRRGPFPVPGCSWGRLPAGVQHPGPGQHGLGLCQGGPGGCWPLCRPRPCPARAPGGRRRGGRAGRAAAGQPRMGVLACGAAAGRPGGAPLRLPGRCRGGCGGAVQRGGAGQRGVGLCQRRPPGRRSLSCTWRRGVLTAARLYGRGARQRGVGVQPRGAGLPGGRAATRSAPQSERH